MTERKSYSNREKKLSQKRKEKSVIDAEKKELDNGKVTETEKTTESEPERGIRSRHRKERITERRSYRNGEKTESETEIEIRNRHRKERMTERKSYRIGEKKLTQKPEEKSGTNTEKIE